MRNNKLYFLANWGGNSSSGFTLIELLVSLLISAITVTASGYGLFLMMNKNQLAAAETQERNQLNHALEYISEDIRMAKSINPASTYTIDPVAPTCAVATPILNLTIPNNTATKTVVYYFNDLSNCPAGQTVWRKPGVIKRVDLGNSAITTIDDSNGQELVDSISITAAPPCATGTISPTSNAKGFYVCLDNAANARKVDIYLQGVMTPSSSETDRVSSTAFARSQ